MTPKQASALLRNIASKIDRSKRPDRHLVALAIKNAVTKIAAVPTHGQFNNMELIYIEIARPVGMSNEVAIGRAKALIPVATGEFEISDEDVDFVSGGLQCEPEFWINSENDGGGSYGPDDAGVSVEWEMP